MDSSDFLRQILFQPYLVKKTPYVRRTSPGTRMFLLTIYLPWLLNMLPYSYWALTCLAVLPTYSAFMVSVRQASDLPPASFRFPVTQDTLALGYILPAVGRIRDFHPLKHAPSGRTKIFPSQIGWGFLVYEPGGCPFFVQAVFRSSSSCMVAISPRRISRADSKFFVVFFIGQSINAWASREMEASISRAWSSFSAVTEI